MSEEDTERLVAAIRRKKDEVASSKEAAVQFLQQVGILDNEEELTPPYRELGKTCIAVPQD